MDDFYKQLILYHNPSWSQNHGFKMYLRLNNTLLVKKQDIKNIV